MDLDGACHNSNLLGPARVNIPEVFDDLLSTVDPRLGPEIQTGVVRRVVLPLSSKRHTTAVACIHA